MATNSRVLDASGAITSILGFVATILTVIFTDYKLVALVVFVLAIAVMVGGHWFHTRRRLAAVYPHLWEEMYFHTRYVFDSPTKMSYETVAIIRVTCPILYSLPRKMTWSGRGAPNVRSEVLEKGIEIVPKCDGATGEIHFDFPFSEPKRFGECVAIEYSLQLTDISKSNVPMLAKNIKRPCRLLVFEVVLRHLSSCGPAQLVWSPGNDAGVLKPPVEIRTVDFDPITRSYRVIIVGPEMGRSYRLLWDPNPSKNDDLSVNAHP